MASSKRNSTIALVAAGAAALALVSQGLQAQEPRQVRFRMEWIPNGMYAPMFLAVNSGFDREQGVRIEMLNGNGSLAAIEEVTGGHADMGMAACGALANAIGRGRPVVSIAQYTARYSWGFYIPGNSDAKSIRDLVGKSVVMSPNSSEAVLLPALFEVLGMKQDAMRKVAVDPAQKISTYGRGQGDTVVTTVAYGEPIVQEARPSKFLLWADAGFVMPDYCLFSRTDHVKNNAPMLQRALAALFKGIEEAQKNPGAAVDAALKQRPLIKRDHTAKQWELTQQFLRSENSGKCAIGWHPPKDWQVGLATLQKFADLQGDIAAPEKFYTNRFIAPCT